MFIFFSVVINKEMSDDMKKTNGFIASALFNGVRREKDVNVPTHSASVTLTASGALAANTHYICTATGAITCTLPTAANSSKGDTIVVEYTAVIGNGVTHKYGTAGEFFAKDSLVFKRAAVEIFSVDTADGTGDDFLNLVGATNAGPGIASRVVFTFNGARWRAYARLATSGSGAVANQSVFATS